MEWNTYDKMTVFVRYFIDGYTDKLINQQIVIVGGDVIGIDRPWLFLILVSQTKTFWNTKRLYNLLQRAFA